MCQRKFGREAMIQHDIGHAVDGAHKTGLIIESLGGGLDAVACSLRDGGSGLAERLQIVELRTANFQRVILA